MKFTFNMASTLTACTSMHNCTIYIAVESFKVMIYTLCQPQQGTYVSIIDEIYSVIISMKINLFSPWYSWKIAELALNNNHSITSISRSCSKWCHLKRHIQVYMVVLSNIVAKISNVKVIFKVVSAETTCIRIHSCDI